MASRLSAVSLSITFPPPLPVAAGAGRWRRACNRRLQRRAVITMQNMKLRLTIGSPPRLFSSPSASRIPTSHLISTPPLLCPCRCSTIDERGCFCGVTLNQTARRWSAVVTQHSIPSGLSREEGSSRVTTTPECFCSFVGRL